MIRALAYAKINLYLAVIGRRSDGYHEIETILQSIDLADELTFELAGDVGVTCSIPELSGPRNLAHAAAELLRAEAGISSGVRIHIDKRIPVAAGLAGGSADAAATLVALDRLWNLGANADALASVAARVGSDVPFCLSGGTAVGTGTGTQLSKVRPLHGLPIVVAKPVGSLSAAEVYAAFDEDPISPRRSSSALRDIIDEGKVADICSLVENVLEPAVLRLMSHVSEVKNAALEAGATCALVSGSGPAVFAVAQSASDAAAIAGSLRFSCESVHVCGPAAIGVELLKG